jgi:parallel beta-helix repeat protein
MNDAVLASGNNFVISGFEIRNYKGNGVVVNKGRNATFKNLVCHNTGKYGVYPVLCQGVLVDGCVVSDVWDAGVYAGQCNDVVIQNCESYRNTIGIETENCVNVLMANNSAHQNSLGLLVVLLPDLPTTVASNARVINNRVLDNNYPNLSPPGNTVNLVEPGIGIAVNAADNTEVTKNEVRTHGSYGIAMYALTDVFPPEHKLNVEPNPDNNYIHDNALAENGGSPSKRLKSLGAPGGDLFWSGKGVGNAWSEATEKTFPAKLPGWNGTPGAAGGGR